MKTLRHARQLTSNKIGLPVLLMHLAAFIFAAQASAFEIPLYKQAGVYTLPVRVNGVITLNFVLDSGASEVTVPVDVVQALLRAGTISRNDFLPGQRYRLADGSFLSGSRFTIRELELGGFKISNVPATVVPVTGTRLLGQSFLSRVPHWTIDNERHLLVISEPKRTESPSQFEEHKYDQSKSPDQSKPLLNVPDTADLIPESGDRLPNSRKIPPSKSVARTPEGKLLPSR
jgi:hypothetical protein